MSFVRRKPVAVGEGLKVEKRGDAIVIEPVDALETLEDIGEKELWLIPRFVKALLFYKRGI